MKRETKTAILTMALSLILLFATTALAAELPYVAKGSKGNVVVRIQRVIQQEGYYSGSLDGIFGSGTEEGVKRYQRANGLTPDGIVGKQTAQKMGISLDPDASDTATPAPIPTQTPNNNGSQASGDELNQGDLKLLSRLIYGEARGESYRGKVAVGAVVLNRVKSASFPNSISGVIYQPGAFSVVADGQINLTPDEECMRAARDAMNGADPSGGALYYYNPKKTTNQWILTRPIIVTIGNHVFAK